MATHTSEKLAVVLLLAFGLLSCGKEASPGDDHSAGEVLLHTLRDMNQEEAVLNSHAGEELTSSLQPIWRCYQVLPNARLIGSTPGDNYACYPRIKRMADGRFIMFYHKSQYGANVWYSVSADYKNWSEPKALYTAYQVTLSYGGTSRSDTRAFVNPDAVVLPSGEILMVCSYRAVGSYGEGLDCGLSFRRSSDNASTWSQPMDLPVGPNWEPYLLVLPDGRLQCYYTDAIPQTRNSGTAMILSSDGGKTWSAPIRVCQQYKYDYRTSDAAKSVYNGQKIYTDQMPCFRVLNDGKTIAGWLEARLESPTPADCAVSSNYNSRCMMSLVRNRSLDWEDLSEGYLQTVRTGPSERENNVIKGAGGYISTFPSGEVVLSFGLNSLMNLKIGNASATAFRGDNWADDNITPLPGKGFWGTTEAFAQNYLAIAMHSSSDPAKGMQLGMMYLNHRLDASLADITLDGDTSEWKTTRSFYLGAPSGEDLIIRTCRDASRLYLGIECRDDALSESLRVTVLLAGKSQGNLIVGASSLVSSTFKSAEGCCRLAKTADGESGWVSELSVPLSELGVFAGDKVRIYADILAGGTRTAFELSDVKDNNTWQTITIK